ncbi:MAG: FtsQ-type POTRA domain-containing protein [Tissierellia bacterium]|nr:FtsQ-type POTRA domain-containing protein [Tissierellia bacterium]
MKKITRREKRRIQKNKRIRLLVLILVAGALVYFLFQTSFFSIEKILVEGNNKVDSKEIVKVSGLHFKENILKAPLKDAVAKIESLPYIKTASITRQSRKVLLIQVEERNEDFSYLSNGQVYVCDEEGRIVKETKATNVFPVVKGLELEDLTPGENIFEREELQGLKMIFEVARELDIVDQYLEIRFQKNHEFGLLRKDNIKIELGTTENIRYKLNFIENAIKNVEKQGQKVGLIKLNLDPPVVVPRK